MVTKTFTLSPQGTIGSYTVDGTTVKSKGKTVILTAPNATIAVVDVLARQSSDPQDHIIVDAFIAQLTKAGYAVKYANGVRTFFDPKVRWDEFLKNGDTAGLSLTDAEKAAVAVVQSIYTKFETAYTLPKPPYPFATDEQAGPETKLTLSGTTKKNVRKSGSGHFASLPTAKRVWAAASKVWATADPDKTSGLIKTNPYESFNGYNRPVQVFPNRLEIGCQAIGRRALEQFAVEQGWDFPTAE